MPKRVCGQDHVYQTNVVLVHRLDLDAALAAVKIARGKKLFDDIDDMAETLRGAELCFEHRGAFPFVKKKKKRKYVKIKERTENCYPCDKIKREREKESEE